jgi:type IV pilus assembly protein PilW
MPTPTLQAQRSRAARFSTTSSASERGFTLVELMVSVAIGLVLVVAVLYLQLKLTSQNVRTTDTAVRDNEARAAMDVITRDLSGGGFLHGGSNSSCYTVLHYNTALPAPNYFASFPVSSVAGGTGVALPFVATPGITLNYPVAGSTNRSDVLVVRGTADATQFSAVLNPVAPAMDNTAFLPTATTQMPFSPSPLPPFNANDVGLVQVSVGTPPNAQLACLRIPITTAPVVANGSAFITSTGALMPVAGYSGFATQYAGIGLSGGISDTLLRSSKVIDLGAAATTNQFVYAYFVDNSYRWPTLVRAKINALTDLEVPNTRQEIAAGVVSFQVLFGVGSATAGVTAYQTWPQVLAAGNAGNVLTVRVLILQRSLYPDKDFNNARSLYSTGIIPLPTQFTQAGYTNYTIPSQELTNRFLAQETEMTVRSASPLWPK